MNEKVLTFESFENCKNKEERHKKKINEFYEFLKLNSYFKKYEILKNGSIFNKKTMTNIYGCKNYKGYIWISFYFPNKILLKFSLARFILMFFYRLPDENEQANHKDGNKENNSIENLEWLTSNENIKHAYDNGLSRAGRWRKIDNDGINKIKNLWESGTSQKEISDHYKVNQAVISRLFKEFRKNKEIDSLKNTIEELEKKLHDIQIMNDGLLESFVNVEKENERLNKENEFLKTKIYACSRCSADCTEYDFNK